MVGSVDILWHGRGGQGAFTASRILGAAYVSGEGGSALAFPSFGPERRGAPMRAFTKLSMDAVSDRSEITFPDYEIYLDEGLFSDAEDDGRVIVVNSPDEGA
ncbi:MAG: 2-oxoacid:acceptor oxidoreductase family protein, partial [Candidatus Methanomethylophilaceae archaeon]